MCYLVLLLTPSGTRQLLAPIILFMPRRVWQALPCSPSMTNDGAHNIVYALTHLEGVECPSIIAWWHRPAGAQDMARYVPQYYG